MAEFIEPVVEKVVGVLQARLPALVEEAGLEEIREYGRLFTAVIENPPAVCVMPVRTTFDPDVAGVIQEVHEITITFGITGSERDDLTVLAMRYMRAIDRALMGSWAEGDWSGVLAGGQVLNVFVRGHDYGPLMRSGSMMARFPEVDVVVEAVEQEG